MKKLSLILLITSLTIGSLVGCGKDENEGNNEETFETITVSSNTEETEVNSIETKETELETEIETVETITKPTEKPELTSEEKEEIKEILDEAFTEEESYKYSMVIDIEYPLNAEELGLTNAEFKDIFGDAGQIIRVTSDTITTVDNTNDCTLTEGTITSVILDTTNAVDLKYYVVNDEENTDNYISYVYDGITNTWIKNTSAVEYTDIYGYYKKSDDFYITKEDNKECTIEGNIYYIDLAYNIGNVAGDIGIEYDVEIPVTYLIDKTTNRVKSIEFSLDNLNNKLADKGTKVDIRVNIESVGEFNVEIPEDILNNAVDWSEAPAYPELTEGTKGTN